MPMLTVRLSDEEYAALKERAEGSSMAQVVKFWIAHSVPVESDRPGATGGANVHAACDEKIAALEAEVRRLNGLRAVTPEERRPAVSRETSPSPEAFAGLPERRDSQKPGFLAAPDDDCPTCHHDRHASNHVYGVCQYKVAARTKCGCADFDLGFE